MATTEVAAPKSFLARTSEFYREVRSEMARVTWPDWPQIRQLSIGVIALSLFIGAVIALMDVILQTVLVRWIPRLFGG
jgi:preprotein translocase subunit SecE